MEHITSYPKIFHLGDMSLENLLDGYITVEEKIDGSLFRILCNGENRVYGSKTQSPPHMMFNKAVEGAEEALMGFNPHQPYMIYAEYVGKPKQNTLCYSRVPKHTIVILDIKSPDGYYTYEQKKYFTEIYNLDCVPQLWHGHGSEFTKDVMESLLKTPSFLGGETIEGIVVKNYEKVHDGVGFPHLMGQPLFGKFVREEFKERNQKEWKGKKSAKEFIDQLAEELCSEGRWLKAVQHCSERGELTGTPKDIPILMKEIGNDIREEEMENLKERIFDHFWKNRLSHGIFRGFPEWYKTYISEKQFGVRDE